ncbi:MAG: HAD family phosphatase [Candidatus Aegiribacteria sp.]|nr:HAD family phosphatase [Candidatus Aegiribacteria sp.]
MVNNGETGNLAEAWNKCGAVLFDFDGVLADSEPFFRKSWNAALKPYGHSIPPEDYWLYWSSLGEGIEGEIRRHELKNIDVDQAASSQRKIYEGYCRRGDIPLFPQVPELLARLSSEEEKSARSFCIASNTPSWIVKDILLYSNANVPSLVGGEGLRKKPAPDIFLLAASKLGVIPSDTLVFEDSWKGIRAADEGGFQSVLVLNNLNRGLDIKSKYVINGIGSVLALLDTTKRN